MITNEADLDNFCQALRNDLSSGRSDCAFLTVDTEFVRIINRDPVLCLVQIASEKVHDVIDMLSISDYTSLKKLMNDDKILKVLHGFDQDLDILIRHDIHISNVYDTQIAEMAISKNQVASYAALTAKYLNKPLQKLYKMSDWRQRPLSSAQEKYALEDVTYLRDVYKKQVDILKKLGRTTWICEEINNRLLEYGASKENDVLLAFNKHIYELCDESLHVLKELAQWRRNRAEQENVSDICVIKNDVLMSIAKNGLNCVRQMKRSRFANDKSMKEFLDFSVSVCKKYKIPMRIQKNNSTIADFLKIVLDYCADKYSVNKGLIADSDDIAALASNSRFVRDKFYNSWRYEIFGRYVQPAIDGEISLRLVNGVVEIKHV